MDMNRRALGLALLLAVAAATAGLGTAVPEAQLRVSDVGVDPATPVAGEPVTLTPTVESSVGSDQAATVDRVTARVDGRVIGEQTDLGALSPGDDVTVPVTTTFDEPGEYTVTFTVEGTDEDGDDVTVTRRETVVVSPVPDVRLTVTDTDVQPATPTAGAPVTVPVSVDSSGGSTQPLTVDRVSLVDGNETLATAGDLGALSVGDGITVPLTTTFDEPGVRNLTVVFEGTNDNGERVVARQPLTIPVEAGSPAVETRDVRAVEGVASAVEVVVANPTEATLRNIAVTVDGEGVEPIVDRRVVPTLASGATTNLSFDVRPDIAGETILRTNVSYTTAAGTEAALSDSAVLSAAPRESSVAVRVRTIEAQEQSNQPNLDAGVGGFLDTGDQGDEQEGQEGDLRVTVANVGNAPITNVVLRPRAANRSLGARPVTDRLAPNSEQSVTVSLERTPPAEVVFEASYTVAGNESSAQATFDPFPDRGRVTVTGVDVQDSGDELEITGDVGNPGQAEVSGVVVRVANTDNVTPALGGQDFFVGAIEGNSFAPFELAATADENATDLTLEVEYLVAGDPRTETLQVPVTDVSRSSGDGGPPALLFVGILLVFLLLVGTTIYLARRS